ncbi:hypothetical protein J6590_070256 [Homalodisca vitripennis]|nr:hypothetical protein J6590_070256 [Homalodisca vitripennis]
MCRQHSEAREINEDHTDGGEHYRILTIEETNETTASVTGNTMCKSGVTLWNLPLVPYLTGQVGDSTESVLVECRLFIIYKLHSIHYVHLYCRVDGVRVGGIRQRQTYWIGVGARLATDMLPYHNRRAAPSASVLCS